VDYEDYRSTLPFQFHLDRFRSVGMDHPEIVNLGNIIAP